MTVKIYDCHFEDNVAAPSGARYDAATLHFGRGASSKGTCRATVNHCVFTNNHASAGARGIVSVGDALGAPVSLTNCLFACNDNRPCLYGRDIGYSELFRAWNSLFVGNTCDTGKGDVFGGAVFSCFRTLRSHFSFFNCEFTGNYSRGLASSVGGHTMCVLNTDNPAGISLVNCLFRNNETYQTSDGVTNVRVPDVDWQMTGIRVQYIGSSFVNCVFTHTNADYVALAPCSNYLYMNNYLPGVTLPETKTYAGYSANDLTDVPGAPGLVAGSVRTCPGIGPWSSLGKDSPLRNKGCQVCLGSDGACYLYREDKSKWMALRENGQTPLKCLSAEEALALGLSRGLPSIPDARGFRRSRRISPGAIEPRSGCVLGLR